MFAAINVKLDIRNLTTNTINEMNYVATLMTVHICDTVIK